jgi:plastocyanin domain-containing protein
MDVLSSGYSPDSFTLHKGVPVRWEINGVDVGGCTNEIVSQPLGIDQPLHKGLNVITFTPTQTGTVRFACGMGMVRGTFNVI